MRGGKLDLGGLDRGGMGQVNVKKKTIVLRLYYLFGRVFFQRVNN